MFLGRGYGFTVSINSRSFPNIFLVSIWSTLEPQKEKKTSLVFILLYYHLEWQKEGSEWERGVNKTSSLNRVLLLKINYVLLYRIYKYGLNYKRFNLKERGRHGLHFLVHVCWNLKTCLSISLKFSGMASWEAKDMATLKAMQFCVLLSLFLYD